MTTTSQIKQPSPEAQRRLIALHQTVKKTLERKWRLGQYAVVWEDGKVVKKSGDELKKLIFKE